MLSIKFHDNEQYSDDDLKIIMGYYQYLLDQVISFGYLGQPLKRIVLTDNVETELTLGFQTQN
jgi:hypothetical protein